ncbi:methyltransferase, FxLD system [Nocardioides sp. KC13]|uniref:Protein-L-isoaspartate O-methyltransferase n=1 Tax=Nocardioides turkmenicus TaxID=2711220 RepID=A0A6M1QWC1_9ACTN|nr:methyltransferase, FxLD system [Nocardioides sp. KC13]
MDQVGAQSTPSTEPQQETTQARHRLVEDLRSRGIVASDAVAQALATVPREQFMPPDTPLEEAYGVDSAVITKTDEHGRSISSVSAAYIQAAMLEQADLASGMRVLEIGSGGLNAAYIAEIVGPSGKVVTVDIDPDVTQRAVDSLKGTLYEDRVRVLTMDAEHPVPAEDVPEKGFDAIIVTVGAWDLAPAWLDQLAPSGTLVVPLLMNGSSRVIAFQPDADAGGDHLVSTSHQVAGFVPMQGEGSNDGRTLLIPDVDRTHLRLLFDKDYPASPEDLDGLLATPMSETGSDVVVAAGESFIDLYLRMSWTVDGVCRLIPDPGSEFGKQESWFPFGVVAGAGLAYLASRRVPDGSGFEMTARAYGADHAEAAGVLIEQIRAWHQAGRDQGPTPTYRYWPNRQEAPADTVAPGTHALVKRHGVLTVSWVTS